MQVGPEDGKLKSKSKSEKEHWNPKVLWQGNRSEHSGGPKYRIVAQKNEEDLHSILIFVERQRLDKMYNHAWVEEENDGTIRKVLGRAVHMLFNELASLRTE